MVVGGFQTRNKVEVIDLSGNGKSCSSFPDFPMGCGSVGTFINGKALVCGGQGRKCYSYSMLVG